VTAHSIGRADDFSLVLRHHGRMRPKQVAVEDRWTSATYAELADAVNVIAGDLAGRFPRGTRIGLALKPSAAYIALLGGCMAAGMVACPINTRLMPPEVRRYLDGLDVSAAFSDVDNASCLVEMSCEQIVLDQCDVRGPLLDRLGRSGATAAVTAGPFDSSEPAVVFGTGGTTGTPKAAIYSRHGVTMNMWCYALNGKRSSSSFELNCSPFFHVALMGPLATVFLGGRLRILPSYDPEEILREMRESRITVVGGAAPTMYTSLRECSSFATTDRSSISSIAYGTTASTVEFAEQLLKDYPQAEIFSGYGATEVGYVAHSTRADLAAGRTEGVGRAMPGVTVRVVDSDGREVPHGQVGEFAISTLWGAEGYWGQPDATASTWTSDGVKIGDIGCRSDDGWLTIKGRSKEMIITGGENVFPSEVEPVLRTHPRVLDVAVFGIPDDYWGERVVAMIVTDEEVIGLDELRDWAKPHLASYKLPKGLRSIDRLPLTAVMKVDRLKLRDLFLGDAG
jgi:fatty-acyl-CoA synthase